MCWPMRPRSDHVYANLISNSLKYTPLGGNITLHAEELFENVWFTVSDNGIGIPEKYVGNVFERFFRVPEGQPQPGTGLGLAIVKEIVEAHGGEIRLESIEGKGSVFSFSPADCQEGGSFQRGMNMYEIIILIITIALMAYLFISIIMPERF